MSLCPILCFCVLPLFGQEPTQATELTLAVSAPAPWPLSPVQQQMLNETGPGFRQFDRNGNGVIEQDELPTVIGPVRVILEARDKNKDGRITREEYAG